MMRVACLPEDRRRWCQARHLAQPPVGGEGNTVGRGVTDSDWCCHSVQAGASGKCVRRAWQIHGHSGLPNMLTRSISLPFFLRCQLSRVRVSHWAAGGSVPAEIRQKRADRATWRLLA